MTDIDEILVSKSALALLVVAIIKTFLPEISPYPIYAVTVLTYISLDLGREIYNQMKEAAQ